MVVVAVIVVIDFFFVLFLVGRFVVVVAVKTVGRSVRRLVGNPSTFRAFRPSRSN